MTQNIANLAERSPLAHHLDGQAVTKLVSAARRRVDSGAFDRMTNHRTDAAGTPKPADGRRDAKEYAPAVARWSTTAQIVGNGLADLMGQGKVVASSSLGAHLQRRGTLVNVIEFEKGDFAQAQSQPCEQQQYGVVPTSHGGAAVDAGQ